jgi:toxin YoeB
MEIEYTAKAIEDIKFWKKSGQIIIQKRITTLIAEIEKTPFTGIGKPELLKHDYTGYWSRRINEEHRIIYKVTDAKIYIASLKGHY